LFTARLTFPLAPPLIGIVWFPALLHFPQSAFSLPRPRPFHPPAAWPLHLIAHDREPGIYLTRGTLSLPLGKSDLGQFPPLSPFIGQTSFGFRTTRRTRAGRNREKRSRICFFPPFSPFRTFLSPPLLRRSTPLCVSCPRVTRLPEISPVRRHP